MRPKDHTSAATIMLRQVCTAKRWLPYDLARALDLSPRIAQGLLQGTRAITASMALRIATATRTERTLWLSLMVRPPDWKP